MFSLRHGTPVCPLAQVDAVEVLVDVVVDESDPPDDELDESVDDEESDDVEVDEVLDEDSELELDPDGRESVL